MKLHFLGTCSGMEPQPGRKHMSFVVECEEHIYWFDAGEGCARTAHLMGLDLLKVTKIIISHTHMDHVGGLGNLLWYIRKISAVRKRLPLFGGIKIYIPNMETWEGIMMILRNTEGGFRTDYPVEAVQIKEGVLFDDGILKVTAFSNTHMDWSYSFLIEGEGKKLVYSGDLGRYEDLDDPVRDGCDGLIVETGHFGIDDVYRYVSDKKINKLFFSHNGREIVNAPEASRWKVQQYFGTKGIICEDGMTVEL